MFLISGDDDDGDDDEGYDVAGNVDNVDYILLTAVQKYFAYYLYLLKVDWCQLIKNLGKMGPSLIHLSSQVHTERIFTFLV